jgi:hypothetical protein
VNRLIALLLLVPFTACTPARVAIAGGAGIAAVGGLTVASGAFVNDLFETTDPGVANDGIGMGAILLVGGALVMALGLAWDASDRNRDVDTSGGPQFGEAPRYAPGTDPVLAGVTPRSTEPQLSFSPVLDAPEPTRLAMPADRIVRERMDYRLSLQASSAAQRGQCEAAIASSTRLAQIAPAMQAHLVRTDAAVARCLDQAAPR